jgi:DNA polymerase III subunit alpha
MENKDFIHLRLHSAYSLAEGAIHVKDLVRLCHDHKMPAVAVTDTNNMFGALDVSLTLPDGGIQPIIGCTIAIRHPAASDQNGLRAPDPGWLVLLAQSEAGYKNLMVLVSKAHLESDRNEAPQIALQDLEGYTGDVICLTGGVSGPVGQYLQKGQLEQAETCLNYLQSIFAGRLYMELMRHNDSLEDKLEPVFLDFAYKYDIPIVATNQVFFPARKMYEAHDALLCIAGGNYVDQSDRIKRTPEHYFKSSIEMTNLFKDLPEAILNTVVIAKRCAFKAPIIDPILPKSTVDASMDEAQLLRKLSKDGLNKRLERHVYGDEKDETKRAEMSEAYIDRLNYELDIIINMDFPGYFLIVADFIQWAKNQNIPVGPGRGSGAGSVVAWALKITDLDPLQFGLLFERFLNPERVSMPDFDIDFCQDKREQVIKYVQDRYGHDQVAQIITFGKLQPRAVVRDVGRVLQVPYMQVDRLSKMIPNNPTSPMTLSEAINSEPRLRKEIDSDPNTSRLIKIALQLEGLFRHASTHAAGVVIGDRPLNQLVPLYRDPKSDMPVTQFNMKFVEKAGLVKFDFLGLKTLTVLNKAIDYIKERGVTVDLENVPLDNPPSYEMMCRGHTIGIFQLESSGMKSVLMNLRPDMFEDIIAVVALYRPGPMDNIPRYIACKHGEEEPDYLHPLLEDILTETYGVIIYQEQVMQIAQILADYSLGDADLLRRAMGKKIASEMDEQRNIFQNGAHKKGVDPKQAAGIFDQVAKFAGYGFNKSHAAAYALVSYHTAFLKANYTAEFMAAIMTLDLTNTDKLNIYKQELSTLNIPLLPPDINLSSVEFSAEQIFEDGVAIKDEDNIGGALSDGLLRGVRYGLAGLKNVGIAAMTGLVAERDKNGPFKDITDFCRRVDTKQINKRALENLIKAGAFDSLSANRAQLYSVVEMILMQANIATTERNSSQENLFGEVIEEQSLIFPQINDWELIERLKGEQDAIGFYLSAHPLDAYTNILTRQKVVPSISIEEKNSGLGGFIRLAGTIQGIRRMKSKRGNPYAFLSLSDASGSFEVTLFSEILESSDQFLEAGNSVIINAEAKRNDDGAMRLTAQGIETIDNAALRTGTGLHIYMRDYANAQNTDQNELLKNNLTAIDEVLKSCKNGKGRVTFKLYIKGSLDNNIPDCDVDIELPGKYSISPATRNAIASLNGVLDAKEI